MPPCEEDEDRIGAGSKEKRWRGLETDLKRGSIAGRSKSVPGEGREITKMKGIKRSSNN